MPAENEPATSPRRRRAALIQWLGRFALFLAGVILELVASPAQRAWSAVTHALGRDVPPSDLATLLLASLLLLIPACVVLLWLVLAREKSPSDGCDFVSDGGYWRDRKTGLAICAAGVSEGRRVPMLEAGTGYTCMACRKAYPKSKRK